MKNVKLWLKRAAVGTMILSLLAGFAACGGDAGSSKDVMQTAHEKLAQVESMHYDMTMEMAMSVAEQSLNLNTTMNADCITDPMTMKMDMNMDMGEIGSMDMQMYAVEKDGSYYLYTGADDGTGTVAWSGQTMALEDLQEYNAQTTMDLYLAAGADFEEAGTESVNGNEATRYDGVVKGDDIKDVMKASGVMDQFTEMGMDMSSAESVMSDLGDLPISIWIEKDSGLPVRYTMDMTAIMQSMMEKMGDLAGAAFSIDKIAIDMTLSNIDSVEEIVVPDEVLNAPAA